MLSPGSCFCLLTKTWCSFCGFAWYVMPLISRGIVIVNFSFNGIGLSMLSLNNFHKSKLGRRSASLGCILHLIALLLGALLSFPLYLPHSNILCNPVSFFLISSSVFLKCSVSSSMAGVFVSCFQICSMHLRHQHSHVFNFILLLLRFQCSQFKFCWFSPVIDMFLRATPAHICE